MVKPKPDIHPFYFIYGPEEYRIEEEMSRLLDQVLSPKERSLNLHAFNGAEHSGLEVARAAQTVPMFAQYRFVSVDDADQMDETNVGALMDYIRKPSPSTCLVLRGQTLGPWKRHRAELGKVGKVIECARLKGRALITWARKRMAEKGKTLSEEAAEYIVEVVGDNLHDLENTLERAFLSVGAKKTVSLPDVESIAVGVKLSTVFELTDAIGHQNLEKALSILGQVLESKVVSFRKEEEASKIGDPIPLLLGMMAKQYRNLWRVKRVCSRLRDSAALAKALQMSPWQVQKLMEQGSKFSEASLRKGILKCHETDLSIKRGRNPKELLMEKLVIDLCRPAQH